LLPGSELNITARGFESGYRGEKDGITYFGCKKRNCKSGIRVRQGEILNDVVIKLKEREHAQQYRGRHLQIQYGISSNSYKIKDLGIGFGTYARIDKPLVLKDGYLIMVGDSFMILNMMPDSMLSKVGAKNDNSNERPRLKATVYAGPANGEIL